MVWARRVERAVGVVALQSYVYRRRTPESTLLHCVRLRDYLGKRPVMIALAYYRCPTLCGLMRQGVTKVLQQIDWNVGREFDVLTISIDPTETTELPELR